LNPPNDPPPLRAIGRSAFAVRLVPFVAITTVLAVGAQVSASLVFRLQNGRGILAAIALMWFFAGIVVALVFFFKRALLPRLNDIGFRGPLRTFVAALWFVPPINPLVILTLLLTPKAFIPDDPCAANRGMPVASPELTPREPL
jgi:membrane protease YdiL (CAAX protease family)